MGVARGLDRDDVVDLDRSLDEASRCVEDSVLALEICFGHPTGDRATTSDVDRDLVLDHGVE